MNSFNHFIGDADMNDVMMNVFVNELSKLSEKKDTRVQRLAKSVAATGGVIAGGGAGAVAGTMATKRGRLSLQRSKRLGEAKGIPFASNEAARKYKNSLRRVSRSRLSRTLPNVGLIGGAVAGGYGAYRLANKLMSQKKNKSK